MEFSDYLIFVDESGDHSLTSIDAKYPLFVLCFCIIHKDEYFQRLTPAMRQLKHKLFGHDLVVLHEHEIRKREGSFKQLNKLQRESFFEALSDLMRATDMAVVAVVIDKIKHKAHYVQPQHPYYLALQLGLERIKNFMVMAGQPDRLTHIIFEARGAKENIELELEFRRVADLYADKLPFELLIAHKHVNSEGLQLADLMARPIGLSVLRPNQSNRAFNIIKDKMYGEYC
jgi:hypothetical protein